MPRINVRDDYDAFLRSKLTPGVVYDGDFAVLPNWQPIDDGVAGVIAEAAPHLHEYQLFSAAFAAARKRSALFLECGLGKTSIALSWIRAAVGDGPAMISAPLAACYEFVNEAAKFFPDLAIRVVQTHLVDD